MAEDDLKITIQARGSESPRNGWASVRALPAEIKDLLWAQEQAADLLPYQLPGARRPSLGTVYVRQDVGSDLDEAPADQPAARAGPSISQTLASSASPEYGRYLSGPLEPALFARRAG